MTAGLLARAARGDVTAQRVQAALALDDLVEGRVAPAPGLQSAELWARLAAAHGLPEDLKNLAMILFTRSGFVEGEDEPQADMLAAEAMALLDWAANQGDEEAARHLANVGTTLRPGAFALVGRFEAREPA